MNLQEEIEYYCDNLGPENRKYEIECFGSTQNRKYALECFERFKSKLNSGELRAAVKVDDRWVVQSWVKRGILLGFRLGVMHDYSINDNFSYYDKHTFPPKKIPQDAGVRIVPGGTLLRDGCYVAHGVTLMPPCYVNVGAYIDENTMIDSHALVGSCAQVGKQVHVSAAAQIGGVLEPIGAMPVIIEDDVFIGGNCGIYEGTIVSKGAVLAAGTVLTGSTRVYDVVRGQIYEKNKDTPLVIPPGAVVVPGSRPIQSGHGKEWELSLYTPVIIKYRDEKTSRSTQLEELLRP
ncbi:MAG: 2,3,4,5-tetrahydropyridine-2,6-dicarboxylate N-succinyltransferase [Acidobacteriota bacterium]